MRELRSQVVVITGASSGLGREAAVQFARRGCQLVLAARREQALQETQRLCEQAGGGARCYVMDVTREQEVQDLAAYALEQFGRIDVWVNNAGVTFFGLLDETPFDEHRRVIETNLFGAMFGARAVIPVFRRQRRGVLINVGSILSKIGQAFVPSYVVSKFGVRGLSEALRVELADYPEVHVCTLFPYAVDTQHFQAGANQVGRQALPMQPVQSPERVASALVSLAERPRRERHVPRYAVLGLLWHALTPRTVEQLLLAALRRWHFAEQLERPTVGSLYAPREQRGSVHGSRRPRVSVARFALWASRQLIRIQARALLRTLRRVGLLAEATPRARLICARDLP
ncbi:MAG TPA: SDR family NAD(P)-dependent oxidoreductase [Polyangiaceae bacterium]|nr:SDR family NAD(P)-dependent oxidoreductase [Polyangiaceae bacterium]